MPAATVGHDCVLQSSKSPEDPGHSRPPFAGFGLSHILARDRLPPAQVFVQEPHSFQLPQAPSTKILKKLSMNILYHNYQKGHFEFEMAYLSKIEC